ncbi:MAG: WD40 repeat domain-containing serine/threonine-protein kinase [Armatimonadetes bacterium]|nr:WD40 repeat domain-containing serine/threonine-protein kinase [Armatimonadota bacterium]MCX7966980.1 WD40 repeat domain-containing serine/threonine-protein kinase [Armatimonadota bacterium]MDW8142137.1 WD40 repeat domain-containing serine/threonine-protein kinase [Armatimonadota bacterium]
MQCPVCGHQNLTGASVCVHCSSPLTDANQQTQMCPECGADCPITAQYCPCCRQLLPLPERRLLGRGTILAQRYRVEKLLGWGGFGAVYLAQDLRFQQRKVAVKENHDFSVLHSFLKEAELLASLQHPNLPRVSDFFQDQPPTIPYPRAYMVMDYIAGESLDERIERKGKLSESELLRIMRGVFEALEYLHKLRPPVYHRDIKPQNIRVTPDGRTFLVDFGIAKVGSGMTTVGARAATPPFSPPEQYKMTGATDDKSDQYALAMTMYVALTGKVPDQAEATARVHALAMGQPDPLTPLWQIRKDISKQISRAIMKALSVDKSDRFVSISEFRRTLYPRKVVGLTRRKLAIAVVATLFAVLVGSLSGYHFWKWRQPLWLLGALKGHRAGVTWVVFTPDGKKIISASHDGTIRVWNWEKKKSEKVLTGHPQSVRMLSMLNPRKLVSVGWDGTVRIWDWETGKLLEVLHAGIGRLHALAVSENGRWIVAGGEKGLSVWKVGETKGQMKRHFIGQVRTLNFNPDNRTLAIGDVHGRIWLWDIVDGWEEQFRSFPLNAHKGAVTALAFNPDGNLLLSGGEDAILLVWELIDGTLFLSRRLEGWHLKEIRAISFRHDGKIAASCSMDDTLRIWRTDDWSVVFTRKGGQNWSLALTFSPFGDLLASASKDETVKVWKVRLSE